MVDDCSAAYSPITTGALLNAGIYVCVPLFQIHIVCINRFVSQSSISITICELKHLKFLQGIETKDRLLIVGGLSIFIAWLPLFYHLCNFGESIASAFEDFTGAIYDLPWYLSSMHHKKCIVFILLVSQRPVYLQGFPALNCSRAMFKKVCYLIIAYKGSIKVYWIFPGAGYGLLIFYAAS